MAESKVIAMQVADRVVAYAVFPVAGRLRYFNAVGALEFVELLCISDVEIYRAALGRRRSLLQKYLDLVQLYAGEGRRIAPEEAQLEAEFGRVEIDRGANIGDGQACVVLFAVDLRDDGGGWNSN